MLVAMYMLQRGTPFIYQGQEIGMLNLRLPDVNMYEDVMTHNAVRIASKIMPKKKGAGDGTALLPRQRALAHAVVRRRERGLLHRQAVVLRQR